MAGTSTKIGDIFSVKVSDAEKKHFQLIAFDLTMLNSDVIRAFKAKYPIDKTPELELIIKDEVDFYAHCVTKAGLKMGFWDKVGNIADTGKTEHILFRGTKDYINKHITISKEWWIWKINEEQEYVDKLKGQNRIAEIGLVFAPQRIVNRMQTGHYGIQYPGFE
jgi:hypothetical protein